MAHEISSPDSILLFISFKMEKVNKIYTISVNLNIIFLIITDPICILLKPT
ncbi:hypothetical protein LEP1GSC051_0380 [Leptospira sp. P2653]|nr:hypothetical protein LEP1GSC051_0380 [Leptospira sp. P2653]